LAGFVELTVGTAVPDPESELFDDEHEVEVSANANNPNMINLFITPS
jgi:hypothetical protein